MNEITAHQKVVNIFGVDMGERTITINVNSNVIEEISGRNFVSNKLSHKDLNLRK